MPLDLPAKLLSRWRAELLDLAGRARSAELAGAVEALTAHWERQLPEQIAAGVLADYRQKDQPERTLAQALAVLEQIPERRPGFILPLFPVNLRVDFVLTAEKLRAAWAAGAVGTRVQELRELISVQDWINKDLLRKILKGEPDFEPEGINVEGSPHDLPYIVDHADLCYIYDGEHRLSAKQLLLVAKTDVYHLEL
jgi:hypothetical protein